MPNFNVNFSPQATSQLDKLAQENETTKAGVLRQAVQLQTWFNETQKSGATILVKQPDGTLQEVIKPT